MTSVGGSADSVGCNDGYNIGWEDPFGFEKSRGETEDGSNGSCSCSNELLVLAMVKMFCYESKYGTC